MTIKEESAGGSFRLDTLLRDEDPGQLRPALDVLADIAEEPSDLTNGVGQSSRHKHADASGDRTAFVLGGGGSLGAVQVGMLYALLEAGIRPDFVVGTSIGSINAAYFVGHMSLDGVNSLAELWSSIRRTDVFPINVRSLVRGVTGHRDHLFEVLGLRTVIARADLGFSRLEEAPVPIHAVATDLLSAKPVVLSSGDATLALLASAAIPGVFPPVSVAGRLLVDGGVLANVPVSQAVELGANRLYVLPAMSEEVSDVSGGAIDLMQRSIMVATSALSRGDLLKVADLAELYMLPVPSTAQRSIFDFSDTSALIEDAYLSTTTWLSASKHEVAR
ncbi:MAG: patatin-like phospholipase family protein [Acidimicrobiales bacterium]